ncbi:MAG: chemotaxis protein CheW [Hyphomicrobiales bacterium]
MTSEVSSSAEVRDDASLVDDSDLIQYVTMKIDGQLFGLPIDRVHDVFMPEAVTFVPMSHDAIAGVLNLRGRIVTAIDMRCLLGLPDQSGDNPLMAVGIEARGESYGLIIDAVGEVLDLPVHSKEPNPANLDERWRNIAAGIHRLEGQLLVILDVDRVLSALAGIKSAA